MNKLKITTLLIAFLIGTSGLFAQKTWNPTINLKKGDTHLYQTTFVGTIVQSMGGMDMTMSMEGNSDIKIVVDNKIKDDYEMSMTITQMNMVMKMPPMMDTTMMMKDLPTSTFTSDKYGKTSKMKVQDEDNKMDIGVNMGSIGGNKSFQELPQKAVKTGDKWNSSSIDTTAFMGGTLVNITNTEFVCGEETKIDDIKCLAINYSSTLENAGQAQMQGMEFYIEGNGVQKGVVYVDLKRGIVIKEELTTENDMTLALSGQQNMTIPMTQKFTVKRSLKK